MCACNRKEKFNPWSEKISSFSRATQWCTQDTGLYFSWRKGASVGSFQISCTCASQLFPRWVWHSGFIFIVLVSKSSAFHFVPKTSKEKAESWKQHVQVCDYAWQKEVKCLVPMMRKMKQHSEIPAHLFPPRCPGNDRWIKHQKGRSFFPR